MQLKSIDKLPATEFDQYLQIKAYSHSFLKAEKGGVLPEFNRTEKVMFGSLVDDLLTSPEEADINAGNYAEAKAAAFLISTTLGPSLLDSSEKQASYTAILEHEGLEMPVKGRLDLLIPGRVIDIKCTDVSEKQLDGLIDYMGYKNQLWLYCGFAGVQSATLIFYLRRAEKCVFKSYEFSTGNYPPFWMDKLLKFGK